VMSVSVPGVHGKNSWMHIQAFYVRKKSTNFWLKQTIWLRTKLFFVSEQSQLVIIKHHALGYS
jgi:hypothetical protein